MSVVVAYTPDPPGHAALDLGIAEARLRGLELIVVHAVDESGRGAREVNGGEVRSLDETLAEAGVRHTITQPTGADVADLVLAEIAASGAELLVVGLRKRTPVGKLIMGSVSQRLLLDSPIPVFAIHGKQ